VKVLQIYRTYFPDPPGGLQEVIRQIGLGTRERGVDSRIFTLSPRPEPAVIHFPEGDVIRCRETLEIASCNISLGCLPEFRHQVEWADIIHYHFPWPFADMLHFLARVRKPSVLTYHSDIVRQQGLLKLYQPLMSRFLARMDRIVATSRNYVDTSSVLQQYRHKVSVIPIGLSEEAYQTPGGGGDLGLPDYFHQQGYFLFVGVLRYYKGLHILLDALKSTNLNCVIAGMGPEENSLKQQAEAAGIKKNLHFAGFVSDEVKNQLLANCKAVVFPSHLRSEAYGVTLLEGAVFGKPLISCEIGTGTSFVNQHMESGIVIPPSNPMALRDAMLQLQGDAPLCSQLGSGARARYQRLFTSACMSEQYMRLYSNLLVKENL